MEHDIYWLLDVFRPAIWAQFTGYSFSLALFLYFFKKESMQMISKMCHSPSHSMHFQKRDEEDKLSCLQLTLSCNTTVWNLCSECLYIRGKGVPMHVPIVPYTPYPSHRRGSGYVFQVFFRFQNSPLLTSLHIITIAEETVSYLKALEIA